MAMQITLNVNVLVKDGALVLTDHTGKPVTFSKEQTVQHKVSMIVLGELCDLPKRQLATGFGFKTRKSYKPMVLVSYKPINPIVLVELIVIVMHFLQAGRKRATLPGTEESMTTTIEFITALFCQVDDQLAGLPKHPE